MNLLPVVVEQHTFIPLFFGENPIVIDFGVNQGKFAMTMINRFGAMVFGAEPVSTLFSSLPSHAMLHVDHVAVGGFDGTAQLELYIGHCASLYGSVGEISSGSESVNVWSLRTFLERCRIERADLLKIDIEGAECDLLETASDTDLRRFAQVTVEFHDFMIPLLGRRVESIKERLVALGFGCINFSLNNGDVLFVRRELLAPGYQCMLKGPYKYAMGAIRRISRLFRFV